MELLYYFACILASGFGLAVVLGLGMYVCSLKYGKDFLLFGFIVYIVGSLAYCLFFAPVDHSEDFYQSPTGYDRYR